MLNLRDDTGNTDRCHDSPTNARPHRRTQNLASCLFAANFQFFRFNKANAAVPRFFFRSSLSPDG